MTSAITTAILRTLCDEPAGEARRWLLRLENELQFARVLAASLPDQSTAGWMDAIDRAERRINAFEPQTGLDGLRAAVRAAEDDMAAIGDVAKTFRIHCVGHGHIDMNWMWSWAETVATTHDTFASVLNLMDQYPELTYSQSQASVYALVERYYPSLFEKIRERVAQGRWEVAAVHWVEGDKNLASGESLCRHLLYARDYFRKFDLAPEDVPVDWEPDTFGHAVTIPAFLAQAGVHYYYSCRTGGGFEHPQVGGDRPRLFYWQAPDGSRVLVNRESTWYNSYVNIGENIALPLVDFFRETGLRDWLNVYGIGNHGGGPTRDEIEYYLSMRDWPVYPRIEFSTAAQFFRAAEAAAERAAEGASPRTLPVLTHELNFEFTGCYTSQSAIKRGNRFGENYLVEAETLAVIASRIDGAAYPADRLSDAWLNVLFNQFHDILPGSGVRETREHAQALFQEVGAITGAIKRIAGEAIAARVNTAALIPDTPDGRAELGLAASDRLNAPYVAGPGIGAALSGYSRASGGGRRFLPYVVYNPCAWERSERVTITLYDTEFSAEGIVARSDSGEALPTIFLGRGDDWGHKWIKVAFDARDVPALGYRTYILCEGAADTPRDDVFVHNNEVFETPFFRFQLDRYRSGMLSLVDKRTGAELAAPGSAPLGSWQYVVERPRGMTAWALGGEADPPVLLRSRAFHVHGAARNEGTTVPGAGGVLGCRVESRLDVPGTNSHVRMDLMVHALEPRLDFTAEMDWREIGDAERGIPGLLVSFPLALSNMSSRFEVPFGSVERALFHGEEVPALRYAHLGGTARTGDGQNGYAGVTLLQDCKYGHSLRGSELRLRMVRSSFDPDHAPEVAQSAVRYALYVHDSQPDPAALTRLGAAWNHPLIVIPARVQGGAGPNSTSFARVESPNVVLTALKREHAGDGLILRLVEMNGVDTETAVLLSPELAQGARCAARLDVLERPVDEPVSWDGSRLVVPIRAHSFATVLLGW